MARKDPLADPAPLIRSVYAYVAYRIGDGADAEDVTSEVFERALRYRSSYDPARGAALPWLIGIARRCIDGRRPLPVQSGPSPPERVAPGDFEATALERLTLVAAISALDDRSRDLLALRYGADLSARQIGTILGLKTNAVEVALHRALARVREELEGQNHAGAERRISDPAPGASSST
jgi:RNA polymerase sigma-70 factor (ECF subfamily)